METIQHIKLPIEHDIGEFDAVLAQDYTYKVGETSTRQWSFYDTFDWRLFNKSLSLQKSGQELFLRRIPDGEFIEGVFSNSSPKFIWDFLEGALKDKISPIIEARALLKLAEVFTRSKTYHILNKDTKTVARLIYTEVDFSPNNGPPPLAAYLSLKPVRGYPRIARQVAKHLNEVGVATSKWEDIYSIALEAAGKEPGSYSSKLDIQLDPEMHSADAAKVILRHLLSVMRANETGIRADIDIEFLHDYRVAIRRTRSALSQVRNVFPAEITARFKQDFSYLGKFTNMLRDLDVYLFSEEGYRDLLPLTMREDISPLFDYLRTQRDQALKDVLQVLDSGKYARILLEWEAFLNEPVSDTSSAANAAVSIVDLARQRIHKRYRRVIKDGSYILDHPRDELMHGLRIECKKLRYLIEFFASLFPRKKVALLIKQLKRLQDNLGEFNDLSVQQVYLLNIADELPANDTKSRRALVATGFLIEGLAHRQQGVKVAFAETFSDFASTDNQELYRQLFAPKGRRKS
ncbi:MAG: CHAD domain-containing protein [Anaerolineales bacterium]|nr:CHAD domain-containing protein [Anaerolineales bacterium]